LGRPGGEWRPFLPTYQGIISTPEQPTYKQYITQSDWATIQSSVGAEPLPLWITLATKAHEFASQRLLRQAFVEAVTALEVALGAHLRARLPQKIATESLNKYFDLPLSTQLATAVGFASPSAATLLPGALKAIATRNRVVHEAYEPREGESGDVYDLLRAIASITLGYELKFPRPSLGSNASAPPEAWERK
jgi:hypothetical protein